MTQFMLIRHGEPAWHLPSEKGAVGWGVDIAPLTEDGIWQIKELVPQVRTWSPDLFITSPTSRTLHTCALLSAALGLSFEVEFDLHEWIPDTRMNWTSIEQVRKASNEMENMNGEWPKEGVRYWEPRSQVRNRTLSVLNRYVSRSKVAVVCHEMVIHALTGKKIQFADFVEYNITTS